MTFAHPNPHALTIGRRRVCNIKQHNVTCPKTSCSLPEFFLGALCVLLGTRLHRSRAFEGCSLLLFFEFDDSVLFLRPLFFLDLWKLDSGQCPMLKNCCIVAQVGLSAKDLNLVFINPTFIKSRRRNARTLFSATPALPKPDLLPSLLPLASPVTTPAKAKSSFSAPQYPYSFLRSFQLPGTMDVRRIGVGVPCSCGG